MANVSEDDKAFIAKQVGRITFGLGYIAFVLVLLVFAVCVGHR